MSVPATSDAEKVYPGIRRVLVYRLGSLGDTLVALPSLHMVARAFPNAERRMLTNVPVAARAPAAGEVLGDSGLIHSYEAYPLHLRGPLQLLKVLLRLRRFKPQVVVYLKVATGLAAARRDAAYLRMTGTNRIIGLPASEEDLLGRTFPDGTREPEAQRLTRSVGELGDTGIEHAGAWDLRLNLQEHEHARHTIAPLAGRRFFAVSVGTKVQAKDWGVANWRELLHALALAYPGYGLLLAGAAEEFALTETAAEGWRSVQHAGPILNVCGRFSPRESAAAFQQATLFIGHDSGPMHLAAVVGTPTVSVFASRNQPRQWFPVGSSHRVLYHRVDCGGCGLETCREQRKKCILSITVQEVLQAVERVMRQCDASGTSATQASVVPLHLAAQLTPVGGLSAS